MISLTSFCTIDAWIELLKPLSLAFSFSCLAVYGGTLLLAFALLRLSHKKRLSVYTKGAKQLASLGLAFGWFILVALRVWLYFYPSQYLEYCWLALAGIVLLQSVHFTFWKKWQNRTPHFWHGWFCLAPCSLWQRLFLQVFC